MSFIADNQKYHPFSKSPVKPGSSVGIAINKSGHTVSINDIQYTDIPWFVNIGAEEDLSEIQPYARHNDIAYWGSFKSNSAQCKKFKAKIEDENGNLIELPKDECIWEDYNVFSSDTILFNENNEKAVKFYYKKNLEGISADNNAELGANNWSAFVIDGEGDNKKYIDQFVAPTDKIHSRLPSIGYNPIVYINGIAMDESEEDEEYIANTFAGIIQFNKKRTDLSSIKVSVFEYIGDKLDKYISNIPNNKEEFSSHTSNNDIHITAAERSKWNTASQKTDRLTFPTTYTNFYDNQYYVNSYGFEYVGLIEDAWIQNIEVSVVLPELRDSLTEINLSSGSTITPNIIGEKVCKILVAEGLNSDWGENFNKDDDEIELGTSEYNICEKDKNNSLLVTLNFTFDQPIFLKANKDYRFYFYDRNENLYALPIIVNVDDSNNITNNRKEVASRSLYTRYDYFGVWGNANAGVPSPYAPYGLKVKLSKDIYSAFIAHENNNNIHITENEREQLFSDDKRLFATTEEFSIVEENINDINNEIEIYNFSFAQSVETGTANTTANTRGFGTLITNDITLGKVITYCHSTNGTENSNIWLKVFEKTSAPHIFKGISDASLNHKHGATLEYTFKDSDIKLEANKEYFFVFCPENQKNSTTFQNSGDSIDCCIQTVNNTTGYGGVCGSNGISKSGVIALHKIYKKPGKFAFAADLEEETTRATQREDEITNLIKNKVEALPSVYTGNDELYINCYGFEYTNPSKNIILDKIEIKFAKNLDALTEFRAPNAPVISSEEIENDICKIVVAKVKTPPSGGSEPSASDEIEIATSSYNTNISKDVNLSQFKFGENILLEKGWNYRFYFYDKNDNLFAAPVIANTIPSGDATLTKTSVANRYLSERYDYWGAHNFISNNIVLNGLGIKLINSVQEHVNDENIHLSQKDRKRLDEEYIIVDENGNPVEITFSDRITDGTQMFSSWAMDTFIHSLPQLKNGYQMFRNCKNLTTFLGELPLLEDGTQMFFSCKLNALSAITIIDSLKNNLAPAEKSYSIHLGISEETKTDENLLLALEESGNEVNSSYNITNKNGATWTINFRINA